MKDSAVLLIDCPDQKGLVARVASLLYRHGANILHADQHQDHGLGLFFMRVEWGLDGAAESGASAAQPVEEVAKTLGISSEIGEKRFSGAKARVDSIAATRGLKPPSPSEWGSSAAGEVKSETPLYAAQPQVVPPSQAVARQQEKPFDLEAFKAEFATLAGELGMRWQLTSGERRPRMALFCSQYLHCMADLLHRWRTGELHCEIPVIISNHRDVANLAAFYGVPFEHIPVTAATRAKAEARQLEVLAREGIELVVLARYMQILSPGFIARYPAAIINVHHSFLPAFIGAKPYHAAHARGVKLIGATSHYVTEVLDDGPIIEQDVARVSHRDQVEDLVERGRDLERMVLSRAVRWHLDRRILCYGNKTVIFD
jgi:formyltetrahydrofolate deformylase